jgi:hypothetical protein
VAKPVLKLLRDGKIKWYAFHPSLLTPKGNWRKSPDGAYFDQIKTKGGRR